MEPEVPENECVDPEDLPEVLEEFAVGEDSQVEELDFDLLEEMEEFEDIEEIDVEELEDFEEIVDVGEQSIPPPMPQAEAPVPRKGTVDVGEQSIPPPMPLVARAGTEGTVDVGEQSIPPPMPQAEAAAQGPVESVLDVLLQTWKPKDWLGRIEELRAELEHTSDTGQIAALQYELGEVYAQHLQEQAPAIVAFGQALKADPSLRANLWAIRRMYYQRALWPNLVKLIGAEVRFATSDAQRSILHLECGGIWEAEIEDGLDEAQQNYQKALEFDSQCIPALVGLERIARQSGDSELLWTALNGQIAASTDPARRVALLVDTAREYRLSGSELHHAKHLLDQAEELDVLHEHVAAEREWLARSMGDASALVLSLEKRIARLQEDPQDSGTFRLLIAMRRHQARILLAADDTEQAFACLQEGLATCPNEPLLLAELSELAETLGRYEELATFVATQESVEEDATRSLNLALRRARALESSGQHEVAEALLSARASAAPGYLPLVAAREIAAVTQEGTPDWAGLAKLQVEMAEGLRQGTSFGPGDSREPDLAMAAEHYIVAGDFLRFGAKDSQNARLRYAQALEVQPGHEMALTALTDFLLADGNYEDASGLLEMATSTSQSSDSPEAAERIWSALQLLSGLYLLLEDPAAEERVVCRMLALRSDDIELRRRYVELLREQAKYSELVNQLRTLAAGEEEGDRRACLLFESGHVYAEHLKDFQQAALCFGECLQFWPSDAIVQDCLFNVLRDGGDWLALAEAYQQRLATTTDPDTVSLLGREALAVVQCQLGDPWQAAQMGMSLCERVPGDLALRLDVIACAESALQDMDPERHDVCKQWLHELLTGVIRHSESQSCVHTFALIRLGQLALQQGRGDGAGDGLELLERAAHATSPMGSVPALLLLYLHSPSLERPERLFALGEKMSSERARSGVMQLAGWMALGGDESHAQACFTAALEARPTSVGAAFGLCLVSAKSKDLGGHGDALEALGQALAKDDPPLASACLFRSANIALAIDDEELSLARRVAAQTVGADEPSAIVSASDGLPPLSAQCSEGTEELLSRADLCAKRARLAGDKGLSWQLQRIECLERAGHLAVATEGVKAILARDCENSAALHILRRLYIRRENASPDVRPSRAQVSVALARQYTGAQRLNFLREAYDCMADHPDSQMGLSILVQILAEDPGAPEYNELIIRLQLIDDIHSLYRCYTLRLQFCTEHDDIAQQVETLLARAEIRKRMGDSAGALRDLRALIAIDGGHTDGLFFFACALDDCAERGSTDEIITAYRQFLTWGQDLEQRAYAESRVAMLLTNNSSSTEVDEQVRALHSAIGQAPTQLLLREELIAVLVRHQRLKEAIAAIRELLAYRTFGFQRARDEMRIACLLRGAALYDAAVDSLRKARQHDPLNIDVVRHLVELTDSEGGDAILAEAIAQMRAAIEETPNRRELYERLVVLGAWTDDVGLQKHVLAAQGKCELPLGVPSAEVLQRVGEVSGDLSVLGKLWRVIGDRIARESQLTAEALGCSQSTLGEHPEVEALAQQLGLDPVQVYSDPRRIGGSPVWDTEPAVCVGRTSVPVSASERFQIAQALSLAQQGTVVVASLSPESYYCWTVAAARLAGVAHFAESTDHEDLEKQIADCVQTLMLGLDEPAVAAIRTMAMALANVKNLLYWREEVMRRATRVGLLLCGSVPAAMAALDGDRLADELVAWTVGAECVALQEDVDGRS